MKIKFNNCSIQNPQIFETGSYAINHLNSDNFHTLRETITNYCNTEEINRIIPIVDELENKEKNGALKKTDAAEWVKRIKDVAAIGGSIAAVSNAAWWPSVAQIVQNIFSNLP